MSVTSRAARGAVWLARTAVALAAAVAGAVAVTAAAVELGRAMSMVVGMA